MPKRRRPGCGTADELVLVLAREPLISDERRIPSGALETLPVSDAQAKKVTFVNQGAWRGPVGDSRRFRVLLDSNAGLVLAQETTITAGWVKKAMRRLPHGPAGPGT